MVSQKDSLDARMDIADNAQQHTNMGTRRGEETIGSGGNIGRPGAYQGRRQGADFGIDIVLHHVDRLSSGDRKTRKLEHK